LPRFTLNGVAEEVEEAKGHQPHEQDEEVEDIAECFFVKGKRQRLQVFGLAGVTDPHKIEIVEDGNGRVLGADNDNAEIASPEGADKKEMLSGKPARRRNALQNVKVWPC
jgi:hypothetical protein